MSTVDYDKEISETIRKQDEIRLLLNQSVKNLVLSLKPTTSEVIDNAINDTIQKNADKLIKLSDSEILDLKRELKSLKEKLVGTDLNDLVNMFFEETRLTKDHSEVSRSTGRYDIDLYFINEYFTHLSQLAGYFREKSMKFDYSMRGPVNNPISISTKDILKDIEKYFVALIDLKRKELDIRTDKKKSEALIRWDSVK